VCARQFGRLGPTWHAWHAPCEGAQVVLDKRITIPEVETKLDELRGLEQQRQCVAYLGSNVAKPASSGGRGVGRRRGYGGAAGRRGGAAVVVREAPAVREAREPRGERLLGGHGEHGGRDLLAAQVEGGEVGELAEHLLGHVRREVVVLVWLG
jgi:hypothetical protein